jgi:hypothetical protein
MGTPALLPIREEGVLRIFIALKKSIALAGLELGPVVSTLTTTPPRRPEQTHGGMQEGRKQRSHLV